MDKISIVMATYNGERFLLDQLKSLRDQSIQIYQVIIIDDCSTDNTVKIVKEFIGKYNLTNWLIHVNTKNVGWKKNFKVGFDLAEGNIIFPCDQDDIWHKDKCAKMIACMKKNPDIELLVSNYEIMFSGSDNGNKNYNREAKKMLNDGSFKKLPLTEKWPYIVRPGCTYCFRKTFFNRIKSQWNTDFAHDAILWRFVILSHSIGILNYKLIDFRRHGNNATSYVKRSRESEIKVFEEYLEFYKIGLSQQNLDLRSKRILQIGRNFLINRIRFYQTSNLLIWVLLYLRYKRYYLTYRGWLGDFYFVILK